MLAWGNAPGSELDKKPSAESAIHRRSLEFPRRSLTAALAQRPSLESSHADHLVALRTSSHRACLEF